MAATRAQANRLANADEANLVRTAAAAHRQLEAIRALGVDALPPNLAEIAELRLRHPTASLSELSAKTSRASAGPEAPARRDRQLDDSLIPICNSSSGASRFIPMLSRRRVRVRPAAIQTPSIASVRSVVRPEGELLGDFPSGPPL